MFFAFSLSLSFIFVQHSLLFDSNNMIHWIISFAIYFISNYFILVIRLQLYQPSNIMVWDLSFLLLLFFSFVISDSIQTASLIDLFGVQFIYCQVISFSLLLSNPNKIKHRATWWVYLIFRFLSLRFLFLLELIIQVKQDHASDYLLCDLQFLKLFDLNDIKHRIARWVMSYSPLFLLLFALGCLIQIKQCE